MELAGGERCVFPKDTAKSTQLNSRSGAQFQSNESYLSIELQPLDALEKSDGKHFMAIGCSPPAGLIWETGEECAWRAPSLSGAWIKD